MSKGVQGNLYKSRVLVQSVPCSAFSLTAYFSHLKLERCCEAMGAPPTAAHPLSLTPC